MFDKVYLDKLIRYNRFLKQRNSVLKEGAVNRRWDQTLIDTYDIELISLSQFIAGIRREFAESMIENFDGHYRRISSQQEETNITYETEVEKENFESKYKSQIDRDKLLHRTTMGIHRDDYQFLIGDQPIKKFGSQGQQKSFAISLKLAQFQLLEEKLGQKPILLLDDLFDKLDDYRIEVLIDMIASKSFGQIFLTDARPERTKEILSGYQGVVQFFEVEGGRISPMPLSS
jgi:DNA replication and repair protein RecF